MTIEKKSYFGKSLIWELQQRYFEESGIHAWRNGEVPHYVSSNPVVAKTYAELIYAMLCDRENSIYPNETLYLLELGAGHGRFCYHVLKHLDELVLNSGRKLPAYCYILSDFAEITLDYFKEHPRLQTYFQQGKLDYCLLNALKADNINLRVSGKNISTASLNFPIVVIANYFFDTIPQDLFLIKDHTVSASAVSVILPPGDEEMTASEHIEKAIIKETEQYLLQAPYYQESYLNHVFVEQAALLETDTYLLFPDRGISCLHKIAGYSKEGLILLTADKGTHRLTELENQPFPQMAIHGSFSYPVNYNALKIYCKQRGGVSFFPKHRHNSMVYGCLMMVKAADTFMQTRLAAHRLLNDFNPDDFYTLKQFIVTNSANASISELLASIRLSCYDARFFNQLFPRINELAPSLKDEERWDVFQMVHRLWDMYFPLGEEYDLAFHLGILLFNLRFAVEALQYFELSEKLYGTATDKTYNIALCHYQLHRPAKAMELALDIYTAYPEHDLNNAFLAYMKSEE